MADPSLEDPFARFTRWFAEARAAEPLAEAASLATASAAGAPSLRMVLVKAADARGFVFYTNLESRKGGELAANPRAALLFYWGELGRQIRAEGSVERTSAEESAAYVRGRPRGSQLSALASPQSREIPNRGWLERRVAELAGRHAGVDLPLPEVWGGFRLIPETYEFWQHRDDRLHDRLRYRRDDDGDWLLERLAP